MKSSPRSQYWSGQDGEADADRLMLCPGCRGEFLTFSQPDPEIHDKLLGICLLCKSWYVVQGDGRRVTPVAEAREDRA